MNSLRWWIILPAAALVCGSEEGTRGSALLPGAPPRLAVWGRGVRIVDLASGKIEAAAAPERVFAPAGCAALLSPEGAAGLVLQEGLGLGALLWWPGPGRAFEQLDTGVGMASCAGAELFGRKGVLVIHRHGQVRFYQRGNSRYREIYSFYTPSRQAGLLVADVDRDGRPDILAGNYWIRGPEAFHLPWRLFAVNTWSEQEESARLRLAAIEGGVVAAQEALAPARIAIFTRPADPREPWIEQSLRVDPPPERVGCLATGDFDGDGRVDIAAGEDRGTASRLFFFLNGGRGYTAAPRNTGEPVLDCYAVDRVGGGTADLLTVSPGSFRWWSPNHSRRSRASPNSRRRLWIAP